MTLTALIRNSGRHLESLRDAARVRNPRVLWALLGPAVRGYVLQRGKGRPFTEVLTRHAAHFNWEYAPDSEQLRRLYGVAKRGQWNAETDIDWTKEVQDHREGAELIHERVLPLLALPGFRRASSREQQRQVRALLAWLLSQFLHGEQGALFAACQLTECVGWMDGKLYGSTQVVDEGRHVEVFGRYLADKLGQTYEINDNLYVILDALMSDKRWDLKFLGMQIMVEGLALGAFSAMRQNTDEELLRQILRYVITDEARHVHFGVVALEAHYREHLSARERAEREDWAFEMALLMRNRFLAHEIYDEFYGHAMSRREWDRLILGSDFMRIYHRAMFRRIIPNLKRIGLLSSRVRPYYEQIGVLAYEHEKAAPDLSAEELLQPA